MVNANRHIRATKLQLQMAYMFRLCHTHPLIPTLYNELGTHIKNILFLYSLYLLVIFSSYREPILSANAYKTPMFTIGPYVSNFEIANYLHRLMRTNVVHRVAAGFSGMFVEQTCIGSCLQRPVLG